MDSLNISLSNLSIKDKAVESHVVESPVVKKEVQSHGFTWEKQILINVYGATPDELKAIKYTSKMDLPANLNRIDDNCAVSIKTSCNPKIVCMADCLRIFDAVSSDVPFHLTVIHYNQNDTTNKKVISSIIEVDLTNSAALLFGKLTRAEIESLVNIVKAIPKNRAPTADEHCQMYEKRDTLQTTSGAIQLNIKCDSKKQRRLQCSFNSFQDFIEKNPERIISKSNTHEFRGGAISNEIESSRRIRKKKAI
jgi:hypothetical protein